jgi:predicted TPR repeat methyltransferase
MVEGCRGAIPAAVPKRTRQGGLPSPAPVGEGEGVRVDARCWSLGPRLETLTPGPSPVRGRGGKQAVDRGEPRGLPRRVTDPFPPPSLLVDRRLAYARAAAAEGDHAAALDLLRQTVELEPGWAPAWLALGEAAGALGDAEAATVAFAQVRRLDPDDRLGAGPRMERLTPSGAAQAHSPAHVRALFDGYAERFDTHLAGTLGYRGPDVLLEAILRTLAGRPARFGAALDLGCGTGLMGAALRPLCTRLDGCDLSPAMLRKAAAKGIYDRLEEADLAVALAVRAAASLDLITAADVLVYVGDLSALMAGAARVLGPGGLLAFTLQRGDGAGFAVGEDLRYAHSRDYVAQVTAEAGLHPALIEEASTRIDRGRPVAGLIFVAERTP